MWEYEGLIRKLITQSKYKYYFNYLRELSVFSYVDIGHLSGRVEFYYFEEFLKQKPVVVPVPLYRERERRRGFNQAKIIGQSLAVRHKLSLIDNWLVRVRDTGQQVGRSREERLGAMRGAFATKDGRQIPENVVLTDDVWTTGATMRECAAVLRKMGVKRVWGFALAR
jgi:ComF family protein